MKIAIVGPGAIGGALAGWLEATGAAELVLCARTPFAELRVERRDGESITRPRVVTSPDAVSTVDLVIVATKTYDAGSTADWLRVLRDSTTVVAIVQNGVEHVARFRPFVPEPLIVPVIIDCPVERSAPGHIRVRGPASMQVRDDRHGREFAALFRTAPVDVTLTDDFTTAAWRKLCLNVAGAVPASLGRGDGIARDPAVAAQMAGLVLEAVRVGCAEGAELDDRIADEVLATYRAAPLDRFNSLSADHRAGRPTEIDARNGAVVRIGARHGVPTPLNARVVAQLRAGS